MATYKSHMRSLSVFCFSKLVSLLLYARQITKTTTILYLCPHGVTIGTSYFIVIIVSEIGEDHSYLRGNVH
mgnify:CR=1 FL=1